MEKVNSLEQAENWFRSHSSGEVICVRNGEERTCRSYPEARDFYTYEEPPSESSESREDDDSSSIGLGMMSAAIMKETMSTPYPVPDTSSSFESGGGDFGGAGAGSDF